MQVLILTLSDDLRNLVPNWGNAPKFGAKIYTRIAPLFFNGAFRLGLVRLSLGGQIIVSLRNLMPKWGNAQNFGAKFYTRIAPLFF